MTLPAAAALTVALYVLVADGIAALVLGGLLGLPGAVVVGALALGSWWQEAVRRRLAVVPCLGTALVALAALGVALEIAVLAPPMLDAFTHLLVFLLLLKLYTRRTLRDARDITFLAFFMLVAVSPVTTSVGFLALFVVFLVAGTWLLMLRHLLIEAEGAAGGTPALRVRRDLLGLSLAASAATLLIAGGMFVLIPRVGQAALPLRPQVSRMISGFSDRVELGAFGEIEADATVVMRVHVKDWTAGQGRPELLSALRWRGMALDAFDGRAWTVSRTTLRLTLRRHFAVPFAVHQYYGGPVLTQEIYLEPIGSEMIFGAPRVLRVHGRSDFITIDDLGNIAVPVPSARLNYTVESEPEADDPREADVADARVAPEARWLARYTRALQRMTDLPPVEEFLFVQRAGNCEYFAAALAVMLRSLGIPARVVNGFQRGEWNPYGNYFIVRLRDAHSWVEAYVTGAGWISLDPSPRGAAEVAAPATPTTLWLDALRLSWYRYVVSWSLHDQLAAAEGVRRATSSWSAMALRAPDWRSVPRLALAALALAIALLVLARRRRTTGTAARRAVPRFYARALRALARRGLTPAVGETAREFARRADAGAPLQRLTGAYERVRFGGAALTGDEAAELETCVATLERPGG